MRFEKLFNLFKKAARSQGAYLGSAVTAFVAREIDFWCAIVTAEDAGNLEVAVEGGVIRRFFVCVSLEVAVESGLETLFTSFEDNEVVDLLPMPFRRALNLRFVAFMARERTRADLDQLCLRATLC